MPMIPGCMLNSSNTPQWWWALTLWCTRVWLEIGSQLASSVHSAYSSATSGSTRRWFWLAWLSKWCCCLRGLVLCCTSATITKISMAWAPATNLRLGGTLLCAWCNSSLALLPFTSTPTLRWRLRLASVNRKLSASKVRPTSQRLWLSLLNPVAASWLVAQELRLSAATTICTKSISAPTSCAPTARTELTSWVCDDQLLVLSTII